MTPYNNAIASIPMPPRIAKLAVSPAGFPVPWFVQWFDEDKQPCLYGRGTPDFRVLDRMKFRAAINQRRCWVCGEPLGQYLIFLIGPMCAVNRVTSEPPSHRDCALYSAAACPFLSRPRARRNEKDLPEHSEAPGFHLDHNPGAMVLWTTRSYKPFDAQLGGAGVLINVGPPEKAEWFAEGRPATKVEVLAAMGKGLPELRRVAEQESPDAVAELERMVVAALQLLPAA